MEGTTVARGRKRQQFAKEPEGYAEKRKLQRALARNAECAAKLTELRHMVALAEKERLRAIVHAVDAGVVKAELARIYEVSDARVGQWYREGKPEGE